ncbi:hypothetical protein Tco_0769342 [Tanacetum coccineum]|uniref:Uncharacterized protein n=1 Tax=Tanacetum coccineum TaxID=301880 RepID=A0ABQ4ZAD8_9ASTR
MGPTAVADNANVILLCQILHRRARDAYHNLYDDDINTEYLQFRKKTKTRLGCGYQQDDQEMRELTEHVIRIIQRLSPGVIRKCPEVGDSSGKEENYKKDTEEKGSCPRTSSDEKNGEHLLNNLHDVHDVPVYLAEGLILERKTTKEETERLISKAILQERGRMQAQISSQIQNVIDNAIPSLVDASADPMLQQHDIAIWLALQMNFEKTQKTSEYEAYVSGESSSGQDNVEEPGPSTSEISLANDEAKLKKMADLNAKTKIVSSGDEHHITLIN